MTHDLTRRQALGTVLGSILLAGCGDDEPASMTGVPEETAGPFPGDGSNGPNVLGESGVVRRDITRSFGDASGVAGGVATTVELRLLDVAGGGGPLAGAAVYLWHCDGAGAYSLYDNDENFCRGVQEADGDGRLAFDTVFPAAYQGRWPHFHFEVYDSLELGRKLRTSQIAIPQDVCEAVYATAGYEQSVQNLAQTSLDGDLVFSDGHASQLAKASGSADDKITLSLNVGV